jgi:hypothetical protein
MFQHGYRPSDSGADAFQALAQQTGGAFFQIDPFVERVAERLPRMLEAVTHYCVGSMEALAQIQNEAAPLLLEQMRQLQLDLGKRVSVKSELP